MGDEVTQAIIAIAERYPALMIVLGSGTAIPFGVGWYFSRKDHQRDADRWASVMEKAYSAQAQILEMMERLAGRP